MSDRGTGITPLADQLLAYAATLDLRGSDAMHQESAKALRKAADEIEMLRTKAKGALDALTAEGGDVSWQAFEALMELKEALANG